MNTKKLTKWLALYLPYILLGLVATNLGEAWRLAEGKGLGDKIMAMMGTLPLAFANPLPSLPPLDLLVGFFCGAGLRLAVYLTDKLSAQTQKTGLSEAAVAAVGRIGGVSVVAAVLDSRFFMGSMSTAVGEKITRAIEYAAAKKLPLVIFSASGGARMQEGIFSLMQMAKTSAAIERFSAKGGLYISVLTHPTTGGVTASFASLGDIMLAEPGALIGFAGPRVIEQTIGERLPEGFQRSEFQLEHGFVDKVVPRSELRATLIQLLQLHAGGRKTE